MFVDFDNMSKEDKLAAIEKGKYLDVFMDDNLAQLRLVVARQWYGLDKLINDPDSWVSRASQKQMDLVRKTRERG